MTKPLGGVGHVIVDGVAYLNSYVAPGKAVRQVRCILCHDSGRQITDDGSRGSVCDCVMGETILDQDIGQCRAYCADHSRVCGVTVHSTVSGQQLHVCMAGQFGHNYFWEATA